MTVADTRNPIDQAVEQLYGPLLKQLQLHPAGVKIHQLVALLQSQEGLALQTAANDPLAVFRTNFLVMHALFRLQHSLADDGFSLVISTMHVCLYTTPSEAGETALTTAANTRLRDYYFDWRNLEQTTEEEVRRLLDDFWQRYWRADTAADAWQVLGLSPGADVGSIKQAYRRLAACHHPDKGGDAARFLEVRQAYEHLCRLSR